MLRLNKKLVSTKLIEKLEKIGVEIKEFESLTHNSIISSTYDGTIDIERYLKTDNAKKKDLGIDDIISSVFEENVLIEFEPVFSNEYDLIISFYNNGKATIKEISFDKLDPIFSNYKKGETYREKKLINDITKYYKNKMKNEK